MRGPIETALRAIEDRIGLPEMWKKGAFGYRDGPNCIIGGAMYVETSRPVFLALRRFMDEVASADQSYAMGFNDSPRTTHADVMLFLSTCIDVAEAEGL